MERDEEEGGAWEVGPVQDLQMSKVRLREGKWFELCHTAQKNSPHSMGSL